MLDNFHKRDYNKSAISKMGIDKTQGEMKMENKEQAIMQAKAFLEKEEQAIMQAKAFQAKVIKISRYLALLRDISDFVIRLPQDSEDVNVLNDISNRLMEQLKKTVQ